MPQVEALLHVQPKLGAIAAKLAKSNRHFGRHRMSPGHDPVQRLPTYSHLPRRLANRQFERRQNVDFDDLAGGTTYYFAITTSDEVPNESALSNVPSAATTGTRPLILPLYLEADGYPTASLTTAAPTQSSLPNYDPARNSEAGLTLKKTANSVVAETNPAFYQIWVDAAGPLDINGPVVLVFWSAVDGFAPDKRGRVEAGLMECDLDGDNCFLIAPEGLKDQTPWNPSGTWTLHNIDFGTVIHSIPWCRRSVTA